MAAFTAQQAGAAPSKPISVFPSPGTPVASDRTTFSFRGLKPKDLGRVKVIGSKTGRVGHTRLVHSDKRGISIVPKKRFTPGEKVRVFTGKKIRLAKKGDFAVRIGRFYGSDDTQGPGLPVPNDGLVSRPDLKPPVLDVVTSTEEAAPGSIFFAPKADGLTIADSQGRIRWFQPTGFGGYGSQVLNFQTQQLDGRPVLTYWKGASGAVGFSQIGAFEILNRKYKRIAKFRPGNGYKADIHEFDLTPRGTALVLAYRGVNWDLRPVGGPKVGRILDNVVQEVDIKTGAVLFEWHSLGNVGIKASSGAIPTDGATWDYFHVNAATPDGDSILVSGRRTSTIYRINRVTGRVKWRLRGDEILPGTNSFSMGAGTSFAYQHDANRLPNGDISLFDNGSGRDAPTVNEESSGLVLRLSASGGKKKAALVQRFEHPNGIVSSSQGNVDPQPNGNFMVGWGSVSRLTEFTPDGEIALDATFNGSSISSYRAFKSTWSGSPTDRPAVVARADGAGATVYASWNGASVGEWKVLSGTSESNLTEVASSAWENLETEITVPTVDTKVRVVAYDWKGRQIGQSRLVSVVP